MTESKDSNLVPEANEKNPLWMPKGSIRSLIAGTVIIGCVGLGIWTQDMAVLEKLAMLVAGFYFGQYVNR